MKRSRARRMWVVVALLVCASNGAPAQIKFQLPPGVKNTPESQQCAAQAQAALESCLKQPGGYAKCGNAGPEAFNQCMEKLPPLPPPKPGR